MDDYNGRTALHWAAWKGRETVARLLLEIGIDITAKEKCGRTALHLAASSEVVAGKAFEWSQWAKAGGREASEAVVRLLLEKVADIATAGSRRRRSGDGLVAYPKGSKRGRFAFSGEPKERSIG